MHFLFAFFVLFSAFFSALFAHFIRTFLTALLINDMFHYMLKAEFVALVSLTVPSGVELTCGSGSGGGAGGGADAGAGLGGGLSVVVFLIPTEAAVGDDRVPAPVAVLAGLGLQLQQGVVVAQVPPTISAFASPTNITHDIVVCI